MILIRGMVYLIFPQFLRDAILICEKHPRILIEQIKNEILYLSYPFKDWETPSIQYLEREKEFNQWLAYHGCKERFYRCQLRG